MVQITALQWGVLRAILLAALLFWSNPASAQHDTPSEPITFALDPAPVGETLRSLARQAKVQIIFSPQLVNGIEAPAIIGEYPVLDAVQLALEGTDLTATFVSGDLIAIKSTHYVDLEGTSGSTANADWS